MAIKRIFSGIKPTGELTLGHHIGAIRNWVGFQDEYDCLYCIVDMHSITVRNDPADLRRRTLSMLAQYVASGIDPQRSIIYMQSHVKQHAELAWILNCYAMVGELNRMTQYKDMVKKHPDNINAGLFDYPVLMAADILLFDAERVPVGEDQKQHVELCRNIAQRFNGVYGEIFTIPEPFIPKVGARIMSLSEPTAKMSKTDDDAMGTVLIMDEPDVIIKKFKRAVTDSDSAVKFDKKAKPGVSNLMQIYSAITGKSFKTIEAEFEGKGYGVFKPAVAEAVIEELRPIRERASELLTRPEELTAIYRDGAERAAKIAEKKIRLVKEAIGFVAE